MRFQTLTVALIAAVLGASCSAGGVGGPSPSRPVASRGAAPPVATHLYDPDANARADIASALAAAKVDGKRVLLDFGADWCPDCHSLAAYMDGPAGRALIGRAFHVVRIDVGMFNHNLDIVQEYFVMNGIPEVVVLDANGVVVGKSANTVSLANARGMTEQQVLSELAAWAK